MGGNIVHSSYFHLHSRPCNSLFLRNSRFRSLLVMRGTSCTCTLSVKTSVAYPSRTSPSVASRCERELPAFTVHSSSKSTVSSSSSSFSTNKTRRKKSATSTTATCPKKVLVPLGFGTEEMEAVIIIDILRRAGAHVMVVSVERDQQIEASMRVKIVADTLICTCAEEKFDLVVLPGGMPGSGRLRDSEILKTITRKQVASGRLYGAISAAPVVTLDAWNLVTARKVALHPAFTWNFSPFWTVTSNVQKDRLLTTSRGPGTAMEFALSFVEQLYGKKKSMEIEKALVMTTNGGSELRKQEFNAEHWGFTKSPCVLVPVAHGTEEMEAVIIIDILRRASADVVVASVEETLEVLGSRNVKLVADKLIEAAAASTYDLIILPGGMPGAKRLQMSKSLRKLLREQALSNRVYGAICTSPVVVLETEGLLKGKKATAHPALSSKFLGQSAVDADVVIDGNLITSKGPGTAIEFSLALVEKLYGKERAKNVAKGIVFDYS